MRVKTRSRGPVDGRLVPGVLAQVGRDERASRHDAVAARDGVVEHELREAAAEALALVLGFDDGVREDDAAGGRTILREAHALAVEGEIVALRRIISLDLDGVVHEFLHRETGPSPDAPCD